MTSLRLHIILSVLLFSALFSITVMAQEPPQPAPTDGQALWPKNCAPCHGPTGQGDGPAAQSIPNPLPNLADPTIGRQAVPSAYFEVIKNGRLEKMMPPWKNQLNDQQIADLMAYALNLSVSAADLATGKATFQASCASCHGAEGVPTAQGGQVSFNDWTFMSTQSLTNMQARFRASTIHADLKLPETELWSTLAYARNLSFIVPRTDGILTGQIINGTTQKPVPNLTLQLHLIQDNTEIETRTVTADNQGRYTIKDLSTNPTVKYVLETQYNDIYYRSPDPASFTANETQHTFDLKVYDTTTDNKTVIVPQLHFIISPAPSDIRVIQIFVIGNQGQKTYVGEKGQTLQFTLPDNATDITFENDVTGQRFIKTATGYADTEPITPGEESSSILVSYTLPVSEATVTLETSLQMAVTSVSALLQERGATLQSDQLEFSATRPIQGDNFAVYVGKDLKANDALQFTLGNLDKLTIPTEETANPATVAPNAMTDQTALLYGTLSMGVIIIVLAIGIYPYLRPRAEDIETERKTLLLLLWQLDETFRAGELNETVYRQARAQYKAELVSLMRE